VAITRSWLLLAAVMAAPVCAAAGMEQKGVTLEAGFRRDNLDWNIAGSNNSPNVLSELTWRDLNIFQVKGELAGSNVDKYYFRASFDHGWVLSGENQDSDYAGDDRTLEFSRSINGVDGSTVWDLSLGFGKEIPFGAKAQHRLIPLGGLSYHRQSMRMTDGNQVVPADGPFPGLQSSYDATWAGLWFGADTLWDMRESGIVRLQLEYHWKAWYSAKANWNLRTAFDHPVSFEHEAVGEGLVLGLAWRGTPVRHHWVWGVDLTYQRWITDSGTDRIYWADCYCYSEGPLNEVNWSSMALSLSLRREM
jgi:hypothetical protein